MFVEFNFTKVAVDNYQGGSGVVINDKKITSFPATATLENVMNFGLSFEKDEIKNYGDENIILRSINLWPETKIEKLETKKPYKDFMEQYGDKS